MTCCVRMEMLTAFHHAIGLSMWQAVWIHFNVVSDEVESSECDMHSCDQKANRPERSIELIGYVLRQ